MSLREDFDRVWPWLKPAIENFGDTHRKRHVWAAIESGDVQLWTNASAALVTEIKVYPTGVKLVNAWLAGGDLDGVLLLVPAAERFARAKGCKRVGIAFCRAGWARKLPGYRKAGVQLTKDL
jgi:hypothetical protein